MAVLESLDTLHARVTQQKIFQWFTAFTRLILAIGFIPPSIPKILYMPFTSLDINDPVGAYFKALYDTGWYYDFMGWSQLVAALLIIIPRTAHLGALLFFPIILNIAVLTNSVGFTGTWLITILMVIASIYLLCWEYDRIIPLFVQKRDIKSIYHHRDQWLLPTIFMIGGMSVVLLMIMLGITTWDKMTLSKILTVACVGLIFGYWVYLHHRFMRIGTPH